VIILDHVLKPDIGPVVLGNMIKLLQILKEIKETFEDWFNGSVVVDGSGNPIRMYHGTHAKTNFSVFNTSATGAWFTANPREAGAYAGGGDLNKRRKYGRTIPVFLRIKNPKPFTVDEFEDMLSSWIRYDSQRRMIDSYKQSMIDLKKEAIKDGFDGFYFKGSVPEHDIYVAFYANQIRSSITLNETESSGTFTMYHGGKRWSLTPDSLQPSVKGRYEGGVGIYFTNSYDTARKYAKGGNVVHTVEIDKNYRDINSVMISVEEMINFVKTVSGLRKRNDIVKDILAYSQRTSRTEISGEVLNNLIVNHEAGSGRPGVEITKFLVSKGVDASLQRQSGEERWLVVFNPKILKSVKVVDPKTITSDSQFMLAESLDVAKSFSTLVRDDQKKRNEYTKYLDKYDDWREAAKMYASDTDADKNDLFGDAVRVPEAQSLIKKYLDVILSDKKILDDAWLLVQHMDNDIEFQEWFLSKLPKNSSNYRYLYDRVEGNRGRKQKYNTQSSRWLDRKFGYD